MPHFGWCLDKKHDHCIGSFKRFYIDDKKRRGQPANRAVVTKDVVICDCTCHKETE